jgi:monoamine oxidase
MLRRAAGEQREADRLGVPVEQLREERFTRGEILRRGGAIGAAVAVAGPAAFMTRSANAASQQRIAIVGGGIAGLSAALTLADAGIRSTVYEAHASRIGGRMHSDNDDYFGGQVAEWCGELIDTGHKTIRNLAQRFSLPVDDLIAAQPTRSTDTNWFLGRYYSPDQAVADFKPVYKTLNAQVNAAGYPTLWNSFTQAGQQLDNLSVHDWIDQYVPGGHSSAFGRLLDAAYAEEYGADTTDQASLNLIYLLGYSTPNFDIFGQSDERFHIRGGNQLLPEAIASYVEGTGLTQIVKTARLNTIARNANGSVSLWFDGSSTPVVADQVVLSMSFSVLRTLDYSQAGFDTRKQTAITQLGSGRNTKLQLQFDTRYWNQTGAWGLSNGNVYTDIGIQNAWDSTRGQAGAPGILNDYTGGSVAGTYKPSTPYSNAAQNKQVTTYAKAFLAKLETVFPGISPHWNGKAILSTPFLDPNLLCSYSYWRVGQYTAFSGYEGAQQGPIHFAGEHCSQDFQGYMEGGAAEGIRAAHEILGK